MKRLILLVCTVWAWSQPAASDRFCLDQVEQKYNRFATDINAYVTRKFREGVVDVKDDAVRDRLDKEWQALKRCQCW